MSDTSRIETIPISSLNALEYCPRSFYYAATGAGAIHAAVARQDESSHHAGVSGGSP